ncbi:MAG TPA: TraR/DksA family transcriptional regulator [Thermoanaerobaculia bacterium]|nr:TraR/DksA family transcriptional regulator [Thermoanaerobaculia bacterium]
MSRTKTKSNPHGQLREVLEKKQKEMLESYNRDRAAGNAQPDDGIQDLADKAASAYSKELNFSLSDNDREMLVQIDEALKRMREGGFGVCTNCGTTIGEKRLRAIPWTPFCIDCQELAEKGML